MNEDHYEIMYRHELYHWWYKVRRQIVHRLIGKYAGNKPLAIADIGCGAGALLKELEKYGEAFGVDNSHQALEFSKSRGIRHIDLGTAEHTNLPSNHFDVALMLDVLEHLPDDKAGIAEMKRILKPGGVGIAFVPAFKFLWGVTDEVSNHYRRYTKPELVSRFKEQGFTVVRSSYFNTLLFPFIAAVRLGVRLLGIKLKSENETGSGFINKVLYLIFWFESKLLRIINFPFGVSAMIIVKK